MSAAVIRGIKLPLEVDSRGQFVLLEDADLIGNHIVSFLRTIKTERLGRPDYGIKDYLFDQAPATGTLKSELQNELSTKIPQAEFEIKVRQEGEGELLIQVYWSYRNQEQEPFEVKFVQG